MTEEIIIDVSNCPHKSDDDCMEVPICNEYGDLMGYQSCEAQTLCPYRSQKKIERLEQENKELKEMLSKEPKAMQAFQISYSGLKRDNETLWGMVEDYKTALEEIREIVKVDCKGCTAECDCDEDCTRYIIKNKINEVLNKG